MKRAIILVLDSFGIGATADAVDFGDMGANYLRQHRPDTEKIPAYKACNYPT